MTIAPAISGIETSNCENQTILLAYANTVGSQVYLCRIMGLLMMNFFIVREKWFLIVPE
ncbi:hypothetical protein SAMN05661044_00989 [Olivibacter domesticus]|uniref:Uncharacterized protein n=1 Tax=Olivibacter domesticus TaxID=407022 RepID=A0A1H7JE41_OLID1|nr:hypothetical protein SAMN05661044_00989 [Olivibacter domesticus]